MILKVFSVFDSKAAVFGNPFVDQREQSAVRNFSDAVNDGSNPNNLWHKHPEDFSLFLVGDFNTDTGRLSHTVPESLVTASAVRQLSSTANLDMRDKNGQQLDYELKS